MSTAERDVRRMARGELVEPDEIEIDLARDGGAITLAPGDADRRTSPPRDHVDPDNGGSELGEDAVQKEVDAHEAVDRVFSSNARFRPIVIALVLASAVVAAYGAVAVLSLLRAEQPRSQLLEVVAPERPQVLGFTPALAAEGSSCRSVELEAFADTNGNAVKGDLEEGQPGVRFAVRSAGGALLGELTTGPTGSARLTLPEPSVVTVEAVELPPGMWPGPRAAVDAGAATVVSGPGCVANLGYVWVPIDGLVPALVTADLGDEALANTEAKTALLPGVDGGVQLHGRAWIDADADGLFSAGEAAAPDVDVRLVDSDGATVSIASTGPAGRYTFINLQPRRQYSVVFGDGEGMPNNVQALGSAPTAYDSSGVTFRTGDIGLPVWGIDIAFSAEPAG